MSDNIVEVFDPGAEGYLFVSNVYIGAITALPGCLRCETCSSEQPGALNIAMCLRHNGPEM